MTEHLMLLAPSANRVYAGSAPALATAELTVTAPWASAIGPTEVAGVPYVGFETNDLDASQLKTLGRQSARLALFRREGDLLRPVELPHTDWLDDDLVTIPKYQGKTNEQFTRLLLNVTLASVGDAKPEGMSVLDPLCGRGTTLATAWLLGHDGFGVEGDVKAVEAMAAHFTAWLRRKRLKHSAKITPVRREGKPLGKRFDAEVALPGLRPLTLGVFTGDTRQSAALWGKKRFDAVVVDAPYGVVHGSTTDVRGISGKRDRSPAGLLREAIPVWSGQLRSGGALGLSWNTYGLTREALAEIMRSAGLEVVDALPFAHRVDASINRDVMVAVRT